MRIQVAIVEDQLETREGLKAMIDGSDDLFCIGTFEDAETFTQKFKSLDVDVVLMDINLPKSNGIECVARLKPLKENVQFLMCTNLEDSDRIFSALKVGATGYMLKNTTAERLIAAIREIHSGGSPMSSTIARKVTAAFKEDKINSEQLNTLTIKEKETIDLLALGYPYKEVADKLSISIETVRTRVRDIYAKLQVRNKTEALNKLFPKTKPI